MHLDRPTPVEQASGNCSSTVSLAREEYIYLNLVMKSLFVS